MAESHGQGQGSTFTVDLPLAEERRDPARSGKRREEIERRQSVRPGGRASNLWGLQLLLVEDDDDSRRLLALMLTRQGAAVTAVSSSADALRFLVGKRGVSDQVGEQRGSTENGSDRVDERRASTQSGSGSPSEPPAWGGESARPPDVIISDIGMAEVDGYELMRKVRALPPEQGGLAPAIALTGYATHKDRERARAAGYQLHLAKPVEAEDLVAAIAGIVGRIQ